MRPGDLPLLSLLLWLPALGGLLLSVLPQGRMPLYRWVALGTALLTFGLALSVVGLFAASPAGSVGPEVAEPLPLQFVESLPWVARWGISYLLGIDGLSLWLAGLTAFLAPVAVIAGWRLFGERARQPLALLLFLETALLGAFLAQDLLLFYVFWELSLVFGVLLIGAWGGYRRTAAAIKMFIYTFAGSVLMLFGIIALYILHRNALLAGNPGYAGSFDLARIALDMRNGTFTLDPTTERLLFAAFFAAFAVKSALWPFHSWLPLAYSEAPTPAVIMVSGVMSKLGTYGFIRICLTLFPAASRWAAPAIGLLAVIGMLYAAAVAFSQTDVAGLVAYSSISHMNFIILGIFALNVTGIGGSVFLMISHGLTVSALFLVLAALADRHQIRDINSFGGVWRAMPIGGGLALLTLLASIGLPGLSGFIGEFIVMQGVFTSTVLGWPFVIGAALSLVLAAGYALRMFRTVFSGPVTNAANSDMTDLNPREILALGLVLVPVVAVGLFPNLLLGPLQGGAASIMRYLS